MSRKQGNGLALLPPGLRILFVIAASFFLVTVESIATAALAAVVVLLLLILNRRWSWPLVFFGPIATGLSTMIGNLVLSPESPNAYEFWFFRISEEGFRIAIAHGLRYSAVLGLGVAWLLSSTFAEASRAVAPLIALRPTRQVSISLLRGLQIGFRDYVGIAYALRIRGMTFTSFTRALVRLDKKALKSNVITFVALLTAIIPRLIKDIQKSTLRWDSHHAILPEIIGAEDSVLLLDGVSARYGDHSPTVFDGLCASLKKNERIHLQGPAGCGKTTFLRCASGIIPRTMGQIAGSVEFLGRSSKEMSLREIAGIASYIDSSPQDHILGLTVSEEMAFWTCDADEAGRAVAAMKIDSMKESQVTQLSGGQQMRLVLARMLAEKRLLIHLDDPLDQLDWKCRTDFLDAAVKVWDTEQTTICYAGFLPEDLNRGFVARLLCEANTGRYISSETLVQIKTEPGRQIESHDVPVASLDSVSFAYGDKPVLHDVDFKVHSGECVAAIGTNGSGKTTAMLILAGAMEADEGKVNRPKRVGFVFQDSSLQFVAPTVRREIEIACWLQGIDGQIAIETAERVLKERRLCGSECPFDLHEQEQRFLAICIARIGSELLILDEPSIGMDEEGVRYLSKTIDKSKRDGLAVALVTHDERLLKSSSRAYYFHDGKVEASGDTIDVMQFVHGSNK